MTDKLAVYLMRIHDIVKKKTEAFRILPEQELEEMVSWSLERWVKGFQHIDLSKYANPFSYFYKGTYLNMLNRLMQLRKTQELQDKYEKEIKDIMEMEMPILQTRAFKRSDNT